MLSSKTTPEILASLLGTNIKQLNYLLYGANIESHYSSFSIKKKSGGLREIFAPDDRLKTLQHRLKVLLDQVYNPARAVAGFVDGRGIVYNAKHHVRKKYVLNVDIEDFFGQIHFGRVCGMLMAEPYCLMPSTAKIISHMCCLNGRLPQGAPTSPVLSNMVCRRLDRQLSKFSKENKLFYTRYADDITISCTHESIETFFDLKNNVVSSRFEEIINSNGFGLNRNKTRIQTFKDRQVVTGIKVNRKLNIDRRYFRTTKAMLHSIKMDLKGAQEKFRENNPDNESDVVDVVCGRIGYIGHVKGRLSSDYCTLVDLFNDLPILQKISKLEPVRDLSLDDKLTFGVLKQQQWLMNSVLVLTFEGIQGISLDAEMIQGTAFVVGGRIITANHNFVKANGSAECYLHKLNHPSEKFKARLIARNITADLAEIEPVVHRQMHSLFLSNSFDHKQGYKVSVVGHPQNLESHGLVNVIPAMITNVFVKSTFRHYEVNANIMAGNSGGPILNANMHVVGVAVMGHSVSGDDEGAIIEGRNAYVSAEYLAFDENNGWESLGGN